MSVPFLDSPAVTWVILPALIFCARICDVSLATVRLIFTARGFRRLAPVIGFFEVLIWIVVIRQVITNMDGWLSAVAYAGGFATGTFVGMLIEERLSLGMALIRVITREDGAGLVERLKREAFGVTTVEARGLTGEVRIVFTVTRRHNVPKAVAIIREFNPHAFYSIEDVRHVADASFLHGGGGGGGEGALARLFFSRRR